jgi:hypothetical protein
MILAHIFGRGHGFGGGVLVLLIVVAFVAIIVTWPGKPEAK